MSEYDPLILRPEASESDDLERVQRHFASARQAYLVSPVPWLAWAVVLPVAALITPMAGSRWDGAGVLFLWSSAILLGGLVEVAFILRRRSQGATRLGGWVMQLQGNQSLVGLVLSAFLVWQGLTVALPALWLLLVGHSFFLLGGLAFQPMRRVGILYQLGGAAALWTPGRPLLVFAVVSAIGNLAIAVALWRDKGGVVQGRSSWG